MLVVMCVICSMKLYVGDKMDPLSALIGGAFSLGGGLLNSSAQSSANAANIAQAQWQATGGYLPGLIKNATKAGINPLAVLPGGGASANIAPVTGVGDALGNMGQNLSRMTLMTTPHENLMEGLQARQEKAKAINFEMQNALLWRDIQNTTGTPRLGRANVDIGPAKVTMEKMAGGKLDFPFNVGAQAFDLFSGGMTKLLGGPISDWTGIPMSAKF